MLALYKVSCGDMPGALEMTEVSLRQPLACVYSSLMRRMTTNLVAYRPCHIVVRLLWSGEPGPLLGVKLLSLVPLLAG